MGPVMKEKRSKQERRIALAAEYYAIAVDHEKKYEYMKAYHCYQKSLKLYDDKEVTAAYLKLLSIIGPM